MSQGAAGPGAHPYLGETNGRAQRTTSKLHRGLRAIRLDRLDRLLQSRDVMGEIRDRVNEKGDKE